jgi:hypothetical protein
MPDGITQIGGKVYDETGAPTDAEGDTGDTGDKISQQAANYRPGTPMQHCGICTHYQAAGEAPMGACTQVAGPISPYATSDVYAPQQNPFQTARGAA